METVYLGKLYSQIAQTYMPFSHNNNVLDDTKATSIGTGNNNWCCLSAVFRAIYGKGKWFCEFQWKSHHWDKVVPTVTFEYHSLAHSKTILGPLFHDDKKATPDRHKNITILLVSLSSKTHWWNWLHVVSTVTTNPVQRKTLLLQLMVNVYDTQKMLP